MKEDDRDGADVSKVSVMCNFKCRDGKALEMEALLADMVEAALDEKGVEIYSFHRGEENEFWFFALLSDRDAMQRHNQTAAVVAFRAEFGNIVESPPRISVTVPVAAIGLELDVDEQVAAERPRSRDAARIDLTGAT
jgi:quinol monooxygenase YgiN